MLRICIAAAAVLTIPQPTSADPGTYCDGAYAEAAMLVDAALADYGTLYSGGNHWHRVDDVGATLDLYRFWRGLPDIGLRRFEPPHPSREDDAFSHGWIWEAEVDDVWARARWALSPEAPANAPSYDVVWAGFGLDILTSLGPAPDWWHYADAFAELSDWQRWVADAAASEPAIDWLQTVLAASNAPWANHWHLAAGAHESVLGGHRRLAETATARFEAGDGIEWLVAAEINRPPSQRNGSVDHTFGVLRREISDCRANPQAYAAYAVSQVARDRHSPVEAGLFAHLPRTVRSAIAANRLYHFAIQTLDAPLEDAEAALAEFRDLAPDDPQWLQSVDLAQLYTAPTIDKVPLSDHAYARRAYNLLSADDIAALAQRDGLDPSLARAAFARHVALENWDRAEALLLALQAATPDRAEAIGRTWSLNLPRPVRLALIVLETPNLSTVITGGERWGDVALLYHQRAIAGVRNLPRDYAHGGILQRDFEVWLRLPQRWRAYRGMRGFTIGWIGRESRREPAFDDGHVPAPSLIPDGPSARGANFARLIAWGEIGPLAGDARLMHTVSRVIIAWADESTDSVWERVFGVHRMEAEALAVLIRLCRFNSCGTIGDEPAQRHAFELLHTRMPNRVAARETPYWWMSPEGS